MDIRATEESPVGLSLKAGSITSPNQATAVHRTT